MFRELARRQVEETERFYTNGALTRRQMNAETRETWRERLFGRSTITRAGERLTAKERGSNG